MRVFLYALISILSALTMCHASARPNEFDSRETSTLFEDAEKEAREIISSTMFGHYDITSLKAEKAEGFSQQLGRDYGLAKVTLSFSATRNSSRSPNLNSSLFEPGNCGGWLYLHCGVAQGHVFEGKLEILFALHKRRWVAVPPKWRARSQYSLDGYLILENREKEGYVLFPKK